MGQKLCRKCGHETAYQGLEPQSCTKCGAIYSKVEEALRSGAPVRTRAPGGEASISQFPSPVRGGGAGASAHAFAERMRSESLYPVWRKLVGIVTVLGYVLAGIMLVAALIAMFSGSVTAGLVGAGSALFVGVMVRVAKEVSLMLADLSDASVRMAAQKEAG